MGGRIAIALYLLSLAIVCRSAVAPIRSKPGQSSSLDTKCRSLECLNLAAEMIGMMNDSADPCTDFFNYACGNFPKVVRYNHAKAHVGGGFADTLFEDTLSVIGEQLERNMYEMLVIDTEVTDADEDINQLYNLTRLFFRSCGEFVQKSRLGDDDTNRGMSIKFFRDVYEHLMLSIDPILRPDGNFESVLAALTKSGGSGVLTVKLSSTLAMMLEGDEISNVSRASISLDDRYFSCRPNYTPFIKFFVENRLTESLTLSNKSDRFGEFESMLTCSTVNELTRRSANCSHLYDDDQTDFSISELDELSRCMMPNNSFSWSKFIAALLHKEVSSDTMLEISSTRVLSMANYFKELPIYNREGTKFNERVSFLIFDWMMNFAEFLPRKLQKVWKTVGTTSSDFKGLKDDVVTGCMQLTKSYMQPIVERMYEQAYYPEGSFEDVKNLLHLLKKVSIESVNRQEWISKKAKRAIASKIRQMQHSIGFKRLRTSELRAFYNTTLQTFKSSDFSEGLSDNFGSLLTLALCAQARKNFDIISGKSPVSIFMELNPLEVNAYNFMQRNRIIFPMAILAPKIYHQSYPIYIKLGSLGYIIGHEIGHGFDNDGHMINRLGSVGHFWDVDTEAGYLSRMKCVQRAYANYTLYPGGPPLDAESSLGNNIADLMGIRAAFLAMRAMKAESLPSGADGQRRWSSAWKELPGLTAGLSAEQLFFIQAAQSWCFKAEPAAVESYFGGATTHAPHMIRVDGIARHTPEFAEVFQCPAEASAETEKCTFW